MFCYACIKNDTVKVNKAISKQQMDVNAPEHINADGFSPPCAAAQHGHASIVDKLLKAKADIEYREPEFGATPLHLAVQNKANPGSERMKLAVVEVLIKDEADVNAADKEGFTVLMCAAQHGYPAICKKLVQASANVHVREKEIKARGRRAVQRRQVH